MKEHDLMNAIRAALSCGDTRLFRQNSGQGWVGEQSWRKDGTLVLKNPRAFHAGFNGLADLGGWRTVTITPEMVGQRVAVYVALEVKTKTGRASEDQLRFLATVTEAGGIAQVVRSVGEAADALAGLTSG
jgi:hypothetical protein